jgi:hypothetical protein
MQAGFDATKTSINGADKLKFYILNKCKNNLISSCIRLRRDQFFYNVNVFNNKVEVGKVGVFYIENSTLIFIRIKYQYSKKIKQMNQSSTMLCI